MKKRENSRARFSYDQSLSSMTAMIDVVFLLLIYFVVAFAPIDVIAHLKVNNPSPDPSPDPAPVPMLRVEVLPESYAINGKTVDLAEMRVLLGQLGSISSDQTVLIICDTASRHESLVAALDVCAEAGLTKLSVLTGR